jgi:predicted acylesterase/phospholipase RssA
MPDFDSYVYASPETNQNESDTAYFLVLSGGAFRGAFQFWVIVYLMARFWYAHISGVSIGAGNGAYAAAQKLKELWGRWDAVDGTKDYLRIRVLYLLAWITGLVWLASKFGLRILPGVWSMEPYVDGLRKDLGLKSLKIPYSAGVVAAQGGNEIYYSVDAKHIKDDEQLLRIIQASGCMAPYMEPPLVDLPGTKPHTKEISVDGGYWNIFAIPHFEIAKARSEGKKIVIHAIGCTPLERLKRVRRKKLFGMVDLTLRLIGVQSAAIYDGDILQLRYAAGRGGELHLWVPDIEPGDSFDASKEQTQRRLAESAKMVERGPIIYPGIGE